MIYTNKIIVGQRKTQSQFIIDNYFPVVGDSINFISKSIEADNNTWVLNNGITGSTISDVTGTTLNIESVIPTLEQLFTSNNVSSDSYSKYIYPIYAPTIVYSNITVSREQVRIGESVTISATDLNSVSGYTASYLFKIYDDNKNLVLSFTGKTNTISFDTLGMYGIVLEITTNGSVIRQTINKIITVTPALQNISGATILVLNPVDVSAQSFNGSGVTPGTTIILRLASSPPVNPVYRIHIDGLHGTAQNPIVITVDSLSQIIIYFNSYFGILFTNCTHVVVDGRGYNDLEFGLHITRYDTESMATTALNIADMCTDIQVFNIEMSKSTFANLVAKVDPVSTDTNTWRGVYFMSNIFIHHNYFHDSSSEGNYIGHFEGSTHTGLDSSGNTVTYRAPSLPNAKVYRNLYYKCGWDSIQLNNGVENTEICYNTIYHSANFPEADQNSFLSITLDGSVYNNVMIGGGGVGIQFGTYSGISIYNNILAGVASGQPAFLLISDQTNPDQWSADGNNYTSIINVYNNTVFCDGPFFSAFNVVQYFNVFIKNNLTKYFANSLFSGQNAPALASWTANESNNFRVTDNGYTYQIANIDDNEYQISSNSSLIDTGMNFGVNYDIRGYDNWSASNKHVGAYSGYRKLVQSPLSLLSFTINNSGITTNNKVVTLSYTETGVPTQYMASEDPSMSGVSWTPITGGTINFTLSEPDGLKTVYFKLIDENGFISTMLSYSITLNRLATFLIDIGISNTGYITPSGTSYWNNLSMAINTIVINTGLTITLRDTSGNVYPYSLMVTNPFSFNSSNGAPSNTGTTLFPYTAYRDNFTISGSSYGELTLSNLNPLRKYNITCYASKAYNTNRTIYTVNGNSQPLLTLLNYTNTVDFLNIYPDINNKIIIQVAGTSSGYADPNGNIGVLEILETSSGTETGTTTTTTLAPTTTTTTTSPITTTTTTLPITTTTTTTLPITTTTTTLPITTTTTTLLGTTTTTTLPITTTTTTTTLSITTTTTTLPITTTTTTTLPITITTTTTIAGSTTTTTYLPTTTTTTTFGSTTTTTLTPTTTTTTTIGPRTFLIDFGVTSVGYITPTTGGTYWNNFASGTSTSGYSYTTSGVTISNLIDTNSGSSTLSIVLTSTNWVSSFNGGGNYQLTGASMGEYIYPASALRDAFTVLSPFTGTTNITGCDNSKRYNIGILSSHYPDPSNTITVQGVSQSINPSGSGFPGNTTLLVWNNVSPSNEVITISAYQATATKYAWMNVMEIKQN